MTISSYQIDNILKAYSKQNKIKTSTSLQMDHLQGEKYVDVVTIDTTEKTAVYDKISYSLMDILTKTKKNDV
ncbi:MAG TPA: hypothetical protein DDY17_11095 [Syntrophaceae bacterium]|jgi:hypothetical protein|nr:hypothetical protein [Syntrophaceae bacterium]